MPLGSHPSSWRTGGGSPAPGAGSGGQEIPGPAPVPRLAGFGRSGTILDGTSGKAGVSGPGPEGGWPCGGWPGGLLTGRLLLYISHRGCRIGEHRRRHAARQARRRLARRGDVRPNVRGHHGRVPAGHQGRHRGYVGPRPPTCDRRSCRGARAGPGTRGPCGRQGPPASGGQRRPLCPGVNWSQTASP